MTSPYQLHRGNDNVKSDPFKSRDGKNHFDKPDFAPPPRYQRVEPPTLAPKAEEGARPIDRKQSMEKSKSEAAVAELHTQAGQIDDIQSELARLRRERYLKIHAKTALAIKSDLSNDTVAAYFGTNARSSFFRLYGAVKEERLKQWPLNDDVKLSARVNFVENVIRSDTLPLPLPIRSTHTVTLDFSSRGLGDNKMMHLTSILTQIPTLKALSVADNELTDLSLCPVIKGVHQHPGMTYLNLSKNRVNWHAAIELGKYLEDGKCKCKTLCLDQVDLDDIEASFILRALSFNTSLVDLSLKGNLLGGIGAGAWCPQK